MRRVLVLLMLLTAASSAMPARAGHSPVIGSVALPSFGSPAPARMLFSSIGLNGQIGYAFELPHRSGTYTLARTGGMTGQEDFDIFFYGTLEGLPQGEARCTTGAPSCSGPIPQGSRYAVVTLSVGAFGSFRYTSS